jgi:hypothetical protein
MIVSPGFFVPAKMLPIITQLAPAANAFYHITCISDTSISDQWNIFFF